MGGSDASFAGGDASGPSLTTPDGGRSADASLSALDSGAPVDGGTLADAGARDAGDAASAGDAALPDAGPPGCALEGSYALRIDFDVDWDETLWLDTYPVFAEGSGTFSLLAKLTLRSDAAGKTASIAPCGTTLPDFEAASSDYLGERYNSYVPSASWALPSMPSWAVTWQASCANAGCSLKLDPLFAILGGRVNGVQSDGSPKVDTSDDDGDGRLGLTYISRGPPELNAQNLPYSYITLGTAARARKLDMLIGLAAKLDGAFESCSAASGTVSSGSIVQYALGCTGVIRGTAEEIECSAETATFLGATLPVWSTSAARFKMVRVSENSCNTVRAALSK